MLSIEEHYKQTTCLYIMCYACFTFVSIEFSFRAKYFYPFSHNSRYKGVSTFKTDFSILRLLNANPQPS